MYSKTHVKKIIFLILISFLIYLFYVHLFSYYQNTEKNCGCHRTKKMRY